MNVENRAKNVGKGLLTGLAAGALLGGVVVAALFFIGPVLLGGLGVLAAPFIAKVTVAGALTAFGGTVLASGAQALAMGGLAALVCAPIGAAVGALTGVFKDADEPKKQDIKVSKRTQPDGKESLEKERAPEKGQSAGRPQAGHEGRDRPAPRPERPSPPAPEAEAPSLSRQSAVDYITSRRKAGQEKGVVAGAVR